MLDIEAIWAEYQTSLKSFLHSKISNPVDVDDLLQDILIKSYQNIEGLKSETSIKSWLFQIANHTIINFYRDDSKARSINPNDLWYEEDNSELEISLARCVVPFIKALSPKKSELLTSIDIKGESQKDYALRNGISYSTLKSRVQKSRHELKGLFENCCHITFDQSGGVVNFVAKSDGCKNC
ncbi:MAG: RNA polymerase sigma factor SigZ [Halopseudomonas aestusnigri]